jgi:ribosomal protein S18 acetylase RimI-like enzyme
VGIILSIDPRIKIRKASENDIKDICRIMLSTDPYVTLGYTEDMCVDTVLSGLEEGWTAVAEYEGEVVGFIIFRVFDGFPLGGYIRALAVDRRFRGKGVGRALMRYAEEIIFRYRRNVFLLVSSFNYDAIRFYRSLGYEFVGEIKDAIVEGFSEYIFRKKRSF